MTRSQIRAHTVVDLLMMVPDLTIEQAEEAAAKLMERVNEGVASSWKRNLEPFRTKFVFAAALHYVLVDPLEDIETAAHGVNQGTDHFRKTVAEVRETLENIGALPRAKVSDEV